MTHILALDQGTTSSRAIVFDLGGNVCGMSQMEHRQIFPHAGWVEHDAVEIWTNQLRTAREALANAGLQAADIAAIGITNQRETTVVWDRKTGQPIANAVVWQDRRTASFCDELKAAGQAPAILEKTGLVVDAYFSGSKIRWLLDNVPGARARAERGELAFGTIDSWLVWNLTGGAVHATDASNASRTLLYNLHTGSWDEDLCAMLGVPIQMLPMVKDSSQVLAESAAELLGAPVPIAGIAGDQQAALFGQACFKPGMAKNTYGTGCFMLMNIGQTPRISKQQLLTTVAWQRGGKLDYALEGSVFTAGAVVQWLRDGLGILQSSAEVEALAASVPDSADVHLVPAFAGLGAPDWDPYARGTIVGLTRGSTKAHIARAALEAIAFQVADLLEAMRKDAATEITELRVDGGACANNLLMQMQADVLGVPVLRPKVIETTALGAAYLAGLAVGCWQDEAQVEAAWQMERCFEPSISRDEASARMARWRKALDRARSWA